MKKNLVKVIIKKKNVFNLKEEYQKNQIKKNDSSLFLYKENLILFGGKNDEENKLYGISIFDLNSGKLKGWSYIFIH